MNTIELLTEVGRITISKENAIAQNIFEWELDANRQPRIFTELGFEIDEKQIKKIISDMAKKNMIDADIDKFINNKFASFINCSFANISIESNRLKNVYFNIYIMDEVTERNILDMTLGVDFGGMEEMILCFAMECVIDNVKKAALEIFKNVNMSLIQRL